jgi:hypothetical protein
VRSLAAFTRAMVSVRARRIGRREAAELLSGDPVSVDRAELIRLLELASAPPQPDELAGRQAAVAAFVRAGRYPDAGPAPVRHRPARSRRSRALAVKVATGLAVLSLAGVAAAASAGILPGAVQHGAHEVLSPFGVSVPDATGGPSGGAGPGRGHGPGYPTGTGAGGSPSAEALHGLCEAWQASQKNGHPKDGDPDVVRALAAAAGGTDDIPAFCAAVLGQPTPTTSATPDPQHSSPAPTPSHPGSDKSHGKPSPHH